MNASSSSSSSPPHSSSPSPFATTFNELNPNKNEQQIPIECNKNNKTTAKTLKTENVLLVKGKTCRKNGTSCRRNIAQLICAVCAKPSKYNYYNVMSCASCKQFFRRTIVLQKEFSCRRLQRCNLLKGDRCRGCRLDKCLSEGMDPNMVVVRDTDAQKTFINRIEERRRMLQLRSKQLENDVPHYKLDSLKVYEVEEESDEEENESENAAGRAEAEKNEEEQEEGKKGFDRAEEKEEKEEKDVLLCTSRFVVEERRRKATKKQSNICKSYLPIAETMESNRMFSLVRICEAQNRIRNAFSEFDEQLFAVTRFNSICELILLAPNILSHVKNFSAAPALLSLADFEQTNKTFGQFSARTAKCVLVEKMLCIGVLKALPAFPLLSLQDQLALLCYASPAISMLGNSFCSYEIGSRTRKRKDGSFPMGAFSDQYTFRQDKRLFLLADKAFNRPLEPYFRIGITQEEFALVLAITFSCPECPGLSESAKNVLSTESATYSKMLLRKLQAEMGQDAGTKKFAECIHLIGAAFCDARNFGLLITYMEAFYRRPTVRSMMPHCLKALV